eukprot:1365232-Pleurochrysis_carterae.AAC.1
MTASHRIGAVIAAQLAPRHGAAAGEQGAAVEVPDATLVGPGLSVAALRTRECTALQALRYRRGDRRRQPARHLAHQQPGSFRPLSNWQGAHCLRP